MDTRNVLIGWLGAAVSETDFEEVYRTELPSIYNYFRYRIGDGPVAEDLTSKTFEKAWRNRKRYRRDLAAFSTWLFTIAHRVAQDHYRKIHNEVPLEEVIDQLSDEPLEDLIEQQADFARLSVLLARLADRERVGGSQIWRWTHQPRHRPAQRVKRIQCRRYSPPGRTNPALGMGGLLMNDDFLHQFQKAPRREFAASLYERISNPMKITARTRSLRSAALAVSMVMLIAAAFFLSPATRAFAQDILHQFGAFSFVQASPEPKPIPDDASGQQAAGLEKKDLAQDQAAQLQKQPGVNENSTASYAQNAGAASQLAGFPVLAPAYLPAGYGIESTSVAWTVLHENGEVRASVTYGTQDESSFLTVEQLIHQPGESKTVESQQIVDVTVHGLPGIWMQDNPRKSMLVWDENGITYLVISNQLSLDEVLKVAESLGK